MSKAAEIRMPALSAGMEEAVLVRWLKGVGDRYAKGEPVAEVETDKATMELEAEADGVIGAILFGDGASVPVGAVIATADREAVVPVIPEPPVKVERMPAKPLPPHDRRKASPLARRLAAQRGVALDGVNGSGPGGRIVRRDIEAAAAPRSRGVTAAGAALRLGADIPIDAARALGQAMSDHGSAPIPLDALFIKAAAIALAEACPTEGGVALALRSASATLVRDLGRAGVGAVARALTDAPPGEGWWVIAGAGRYLRLCMLGDLDVAEASPVSVVANAIQLVIGDARERALPVAGQVEIVSSVRCALLADGDAFSLQESATFLRLFGQLIERPLMIVV